MRPSDKEILTSRMIDRSVRPLFPAGFSSDIQLMCNLLAVDGSNDPDIAALNAASAALALSDIPWNGPIGAVRVGFVDGRPVINPSRKLLQNSQLDMVVSGVKDNKIVMLESSAENLHHEHFLNALEVGVEHTQIIVKAIEDYRQEFGKKKRKIVTFPQLGDEISQALYSLVAIKLMEIFTNKSHHKISRDMAVSDVRNRVLSQLKKQYKNADPELLSDCFNSTCKQVFRDLIFKTNKRCDGRSLTDLRPISCEVDLYKPLHGSALFQRGQTQVFSTVTFDSPDSSAKVDTISSIVGGIKEKNFYVHYEFPSYAINDTGKTGVIGRRELGHTALVEKSLRPVIPSDYPFDIRLTAEVLESNGSSSMSSTCAGSLALMDAGVPISEAVAGVAVGLVTQLDDSGQINHYKLLTDLLGIEDYMGDMDLKMTGTRKGITALQADIKITGLPLEIVKEAILQSNDARNRILEIMAETQSKHRLTHKLNRPVIEKLEVPESKISRFAGPGGYTIRKLMADTGVSVMSESASIYQLFAPNQQALDEAKQRIKDLLADQKEPVLEFGAVYSGKIVELRDSGVMVQLYPTMTPALVHNSQLDHQKIQHPCDLGLEVGEDIQLRFFGFDPSNGSMRLSRKVLFSNVTEVVKTLSTQKSNSNQFVGLNLENRYNFIKRKKQQRILHRFMAAINSQESTKYKAHMYEDKLIVNGNRYGMENIHDLPDEISPEILDTPTNGLMTAFTAFSPLSNYYLCKQTVNGVEYNCDLQHFLHKKALTFGDLDTAAKIMKEQNPGFQIRVGEVITGFVQSVWDQKKEDIKSEGLRAKFQDPELKQFLLNTGDTHIVLTGKDKFWGCGYKISDPMLWDCHNWANTAKNTMGELLMEIRRELKSQRN